MRLSYDKTIPTGSAPLVLDGPEELRVEIHIRANDDETVTLLALSGKDVGKPAEKVLQQGPYHLYDQAVAAKRAIVASLKEAGFRLSEDQQVFWSMDVQRTINVSRKQKADSQLDYRFNPKDVFLDW